MSWPRDATPSTRLRRAGRVPRRARQPLTTPVLPHDAARCSGVRPVSPRTSTLRSCSGQAPHARFTSTRSPAARPWEPIRPSIRTVGGALATCTPHPRSRTPILPTSHWKATHHTGAAPCRAANSMGSSSTENPAYRRVYSGCQRKTCNLVKTTVDNRISNLHSVFFIRQHFANARIPARAKIDWVICMNAPWSLR